MTTQDNQLESQLVNICSFACNCTAYETEAYTCNRETDKHRSEYCGSYKSLEKYGEQSRFYKTWRFKKNV